jgi:hypothetical protein
MTETYSAEIYRKEGAAFRSIRVHVNADDSVGSRTVLACLPGPAEYVMRGNGKRVTGTVTVL